MLDQVGNPKPKASTPPSASSSPSPTPKASPAKSPSPSPSPSDGATAHPVIVSFSRPDTTGMSWVVLALLIAGAFLLLAGPTALVYGSPGARAAIGGGSRRIGWAVSRIRHTPRPRRPGTWRRTS